LRWSDGFDYQEPLLIELHARQIYDAVFAWHQAADADAVVGGFEV
jgi:hypothetical protein